MGVRVDEAGNQAAAGGVDAGVGGRCLARGADPGHGAALEDHGRIGADAERSVPVLRIHGDEHPDARDQLAHAALLPTAATAAAASSAVREVARTRPPTTTVRTSAAV